MSPLAPGPAGRTSACAVRREDVSRVVRVARGVFHTSRPVPADGVPRGAELLPFRRTTAGAGASAGCARRPRLSGRGRAGRWCSSPGRWARPSCCGSWSSRASARTLPLWGDVRLAELAPPVGAVTGCRGRAGRAGDRPASWLGGPATSVGQFSRRRPGWDEEPP